MAEDGLQSLITSLKKSEENLNKAYQRFLDTDSLIEREFREVKLQCCIFQFDLNREMVSVVQLSSTGFAEAVALKGIVHRLFEYDTLLRSSLKPRLLTMTKSRDIKIDEEALKELELQTKPALKKLRKWVDVRNKAAGHYDADLELQVNLINTLSTAEVLDVACEFIRYNLGLLIILRDAGEGPEA